MREPRVLRGRALRSPSPAATSDSRQTPLETRRSLRLPLPQMPQAPTPIKTFRGPGVGRGLASGIINTAFVMGGALGLAVLASLAGCSRASLNRPLRAPMAITWPSPWARSARSRRPAPVRCCLAPRSGARAGTFTSDRRPRARPVKRVASHGRRHKASGRRHGACGPRPDARLVARGVRSPCTSVDPGPARPRRASGSCGRRCR